jgi:hypothetical protein
MNKIKINNILINKSGKPAHRICAFRSPATHRKGKTNIPKREDSSSRRGHADVPHHTECVYVAELGLCPHAENRGVLGTAEIPTADDATRGAEIKLVRI